MEPWESWSWDAARHCAWHLCAKDEGDLSRCAKDTKPGGVISTGKRWDMLETPNDLGERNDSRDMDVKVMHACRD